MLKFSWEWDIITRGATTRKICAFEDILKQLFLKNSRLYLRGCETNHTVDKKLYTKNNFLKKIIEFIPPCLVFPPPPQISHIIFLNNSHLPSPSRYGQRADKKGIALGGICRPIQIRPTRGHLVRPGSRRGPVCPPWRRPGEGSFQGEGRRTDVRHPYAYPLPCDFLSARITTRLVCCGSIRSNLSLR